MARNKNKIIKWIDQTLKEIKEARLGYWSFLIKKAEKGELKMNDWEKWYHGL